MSHLYENPKYYDIAFSFRDSAKEVGVIEEAVQRYSRIPVSRVLEFACGNAPHLEEIARRGYQYVGLDLSRSMIDFSQRKADQLGVSAELILANMVDFQLDEPVDLAFILVGSLLVKGTADLLSHFDRAGRALRKGGLYFLDWCVNFDPKAERTDCWETERDGIRVKTSYLARPSDLVEQLAAETITVEVEEDGKREVFQEISQWREIYPQEFLLLIAHETEFEFVGWWNNWDLSRPLVGTEPIDRPITILRRQ